MNLDLARQITDDQQAKSILIQHGALDPLLESKARDGFPRIFNRWQDEQAFYIGALCHGYDNPEDNGFVVWILPYEGFTLEEAMRIFNAVVARGRDNSQPGIEAWRPMGEPIAN